MQGSRKWSSWSGLGRTNFQSLVGVVICDRLILVGVVMCCWPAWRVHQCSVWIRNSCRTLNSCNKQVSESSNRNARLKPKLKGKQWSIDHHHHHGYKCWRYCCSYEAQLATYRFPVSQKVLRKMVERSCQSSWFSRWLFSYTTMRAKMHYFDFYMFVL